jgi:hypothetical protein
MNGSGSDKNCGTPNGRLKISKEIFEPDGKQTFGSSTAILTHTDTFR